MPGTVTIRREHLVARFDVRRAAVLDELMPLTYAHSADGLPAHVRSASAVRRFAGRLVIVQDDVNALAVRDESGAVRPVLLPAHASGLRVFDDTLGNKHQKLDLEACVALPGGPMVAFGSGSLPARERLVVWKGTEPPAVVAAASLYRALRDAVTQRGQRLNIEGAVVRCGRLELFHRGNDVPGAGAASPSAIAALDLRELENWLTAGAASPRVVAVTTVELGAEQGVSFGFTDAVALDDERIVVLACAEDAADAISDGPVLGCRVGLLDEHGLRMVDVYDPAGRRTLLKLEGIEPRPESSTQFDVVADLDRPSAPAQLGRLVWEWQ